MMVKKNNLLLFSFLLLPLSLLVTACNSFEKKKDKVVVLSFQNTSEREKKIQLEMNIDSSLMFFSPLFNEGIPDSFTIFRFKTQKEKIKITLLESYFDLKLDTLIKLKKDTSYILVQFSYLPDSTITKRFNQDGLEVDSLIVNNEIPSLSLERMDYW